MHELYFQLGMLLFAWLNAMPFMFPMINSIIYADYKQQNASINELDVASFTVWYKVDVAGAGFLTCLLLLGFKWGYSNELFDPSNPPKGFKAKFMFTMVFGLVMTLIGQAVITYVPLDWSGFLSINFILVFFGLGMVLCCIEVWNSSMDKHEDSLAGGVCCLHVEDDDSDSEEGISFNEVNKTTTSERFAVLKKTGEKVGTWVISGSQQPLVFKATEQLQALGYLIVIEDEEKERIKMEHENKRISLRWSIANVQMRCSTGIVALGMITWFGDILFQTALQKGGSYVSGFGNGTCTLNAIPEYTGTQTAYSYFFWPLALLVLGILSLVYIDARTHGVYDIIIDKKEIEDLTKKIKKSISKNIKVATEAAPTPVKLNNGWLFQWAYISFVRVLFVIVSFYGFAYFPNLVQDMGCGIQAVKNTLYMLAFGAFNGCLSNEMVFSWYKTDKEKKGIARLFWYGCLIHIGLCVTLSLLAWNYNSATTSNVVSKTQCTSSNTNFMMSISFFWSFSSAAVYYWQFGLVKRYYVNDTTRYPNALALNMWNYGFDVLGISSMQAIVYGGNSIGYTQGYNYDAIVLASISLGVAGLTFFGYLGMHRSCKDFCDMFRGE